MKDAIWELLRLSPDDFEGVEDWSLRLIGIPANLWAIMGLLAAFAVLAWIVIRSYRGEGTSHPRAKAVLGTIRIIVLILLMLVILQPAIVLRFTNTQHSMVVVLLDDTLSMAWTDRYADEAQRRAVADLLHIRPDEFTGDKPPSRVEIVRRVLAWQRGPLSQLAKDHPLRIFRFGGVPGEKGAYTELLAAVERHEPPERGQQPPGAPTDPVAAEVERAAGRLAARGFATNLGQALREAVEKLEGHRIAAVIVISDGQNTAEADTQGRLAATIQMMRQRQVPIYSVAVGDPIPPKNIMVAQLQGPGHLRKGSTGTFTTFLTNRYFGETQVDVHLLRAPAGTENWEAAASAEGVKLLGGTAEAEAGKLQAVTLEAEATEVGEYVYKAVVKPHPAEMIRTDNEASTLVRVTDEKVSILLISGDSGWEHQCLRNYLLQHPEHYRVSVWQQDADPRFNQEASTGMKLTALPMTRDELFAYDLILLYDPSYTPDSVDEKFLGLLEEFVSRHHGGLCYLVGNKFTDDNLLPGGPFDELASLLPVVLAPHKGGFAARMRVKRTAWQIEPTPAGQEHPLMRLAATVEENRQAWQGMPGIYDSHPVARLKTLATALAVSGDPARQTDEAQREPVIAVQYYGKGRALYMGFDGTWRWRCVDEARRYQRFWSNVVDFLAAGRLEKKRILITTGGEAFVVGSKIRVRVEAYNRDFTPLEAKAFRVRMTRVGSDPYTEHVLQAERPGFFEGSVLADRTGQFKLHAVPDPGAAALWTEEDVLPRRIEVRLPQGERLRPEANYQTLRALAGEESHFLPVHEIDRLPPRVPLAKLTSVQEVPRMAWNTMFLLVVLGTLLLTEWTIRKIFNMV